MTPLRKLGIRALHIRILLLLLPHMIVEVCLDLRFIHLPVRRVEEVLCKFGRGARERTRGRIVAALDARLGVCHGNEEVGCRLTVRGFVSTFIDNITMRSPMKKGEN